VTWHVTPLPLTGAAWPLAQLQAACFPDDAWGEEAIARILLLPGAFGALAWEEEVPAGYALARNLGEEGEILSLGVVPACRRRGAGRGLLDAVMASASQQGFLSLVLEVAEPNLAARRLYAGCGFVQVGRRPHYYRHKNSVADALIMRRAMWGETGRL